MRSKAVIGLDQVAALKWTPSHGKKLKAIRGETSMRSLAETITNKGIPCSWQNIQRLENGITSTVPVQTIEAILEGCKAPLDALYPLIVLTDPQYS